MESIVENVVAGSRSSYEVAAKDSEACSHSQTLISACGPKEEALVQEKQKGYDQ